MYYESADDVRLRLQRCIVCHKGVAVMVDDVVDKKTVKVTSLLSREEYHVKWEELDLRPSSLPLGYVQIDNNTLGLASRKPARKYKQGLTQENISISRVLVKRGQEERINVPITSKQMLRTLHGKFPDIGDAFQRVRDGSCSIQAFHKDWAVASDEGDLCLVHRGEIVAYATDNTVKLLPERVYLKEVLEACLK